MAITDNLKLIVEKQKSVLQELETETNLIAENDLTIENDNMKEELEGLKAEYSCLKQKHDELLNENSSLKNALYEQIYNERISILNMSSHKLNIYFESNYEGEINRLTEFENRVKAKIDSMAKMLKDNYIDAKDEIYERLDELSVLLDKKVTVAKEEYAKGKGAFSENEKTEFENLKNEQITDDTIKKIAKKNNIESFVGLNLINKLGILLIVIGVIAASQYSYFKLPDLLKGIMMFGLGGLMLVAGEVLNRRKPNIFSLGVTSGGVAILYVALSVSYFGLKILDMYPAIILCVLITTGAFVLSQRYNSQTIAAFALIGGYLPIFSIGAGKTLIYSSMVYFVALNLFALIISFRKKWVVSAYIGFILNLVGTIYITSIMLSYVPVNFDVSYVITILYVLFAFLIYTLIPLTSTYFSKTKLKKYDVVLLAINTFMSAVIMYFVFDDLNLEDYTGLLAVVFAAVYLLAGRLVESKFNGEKNTEALFYLTGFCFTVLIIPFQFGKAWLSIGWLAEGVALTIYGILKNEKNFRKGGFIINVLCVASFLWFDLIQDIDYLFAYKYFAITLGSLIILGSYIYTKTLSGKFAKVYKYITVCNLWIYSMYLIVEIIGDMKVMTQFNMEYMISALAIAVTFLIAYTAPRIRILSDTGMKVISMILYGIGILSLFILNSNVSPLRSEAVSPFMQVMGGAVLVIIGLLSVFAMRDLMLCLVMEKKLGVEWYPLIVSIYFVSILTQNLIEQYNLSITNGAISIIYVITALSWIVFGFIRRYAFIRRFGLGLAILSVIKLFILDLSFLTDIYRIVSYFALGATLVAISFVYQYFNKRLELKGGVVSDDQKNK